MKSVRFLKIVMLVLLAGGLFAEEYKYLIFASEFTKGYKCVCVINLSENKVLMYATDLNLGEMKAQMYFFELSGIEGVDINLTIKNVQISNKFNTGSHELGIVKIEDSETMVPLLVKNQGICTFGNDPMTGVVFLTNEADWTYWIPESKEVMAACDISKIAQICMKKARNRTQDK